MGRATNKSGRFTASKVCWPGFWRHWGVWGGRPPWSLFPEGGGVRGGGLLAAGFPG